MSDSSDQEANRLTGRVQRYARVGANMGGVAARMAGQRLFGMSADRDKDAAELAAALGGLKGPLMKVAQLLSTIPDALPQEYTEKLGSLQSQAPAMGWPFVKRRMAAELGPDWQSNFSEFGREATASASLGQVHRAVLQSDEQVACKLQYPEMESAVEADLNQLKIVLSIYKRMDSAINTSEISKEISARLREELDYFQESRHMRLYGLIFENDELIRVPNVNQSLSTRRLLTMSWMEGNPLLNYKDHDLESRNVIARAMFKAWWFPFSHYGIIHGDPHLGNYTIFENEENRPAGINLLDYGCMRAFPVKFVQGVIDLYQGLRTDNRDLIVHAYETWGFSGLSNDLIDILNIWANFIYGPLLEDRERSLADGISPAEYGRSQAFQVHKGLREKGPVTVPREFVFMDRAALGLGGVFLHLNARLNFYRIFNEYIENFDMDVLSQRQKAAFEKAGMQQPQPESEL